MYRGLLLVFLILLVETRLTESSCAEQETQRSTSDVSTLHFASVSAVDHHIFVASWSPLVFFAQESPSFRLAARNLLKRYHDIDYDSFVGLMGRRSAGEKAVSYSAWLLKWDDCKRCFCHDSRITRLAWLVWKNNVAKSGNNNTKKNKKKNKNNTFKPPKHEKERENTTAKQKQH